MNSVCPRAKLKGRLISAPNNGFCVVFINSSILSCLVFLNKTDIKRSWKRQMCKLSFVRCYVYMLMLIDANGESKHTHLPIANIAAILCKELHLSALNKPWFLRAKFIISHSELRPEKVSGWHLPWWSPVRDYVSELRSHVLFWGSHEASVRKLANWKGWFTGKKPQTQPNWTRLRSVHAHK